MHRESAEFSAIRKIPAGHYAVTNKLNDCTLREVATVDEGR